MECKEGKGGVSDGLMALINEGRGAGKPPLHKTAQQGAAKD